MTRHSHHHIYGKYATRILLFVSRPFQYIFPSKYHTGDLYVIGSMQNNYPALKSCSIFIVLIFFTGLYHGHAQAVTEHATLMGWEGRTLRFMLDRSHNFGGTNYNRGLFRDNINLMSPEHGIDLLTYRFTLADDYNWQTSTEAYRLSFGSLNAKDFAVENKIKSTYEIDGRNDFKIDGTHEENLRATRFFFELGYEHHFEGNHHVGGKHTFTNDKSDLDLTAYYRYGSFDKGMIYAGITLLDWTGNVVQGLANESSNEYNDLYSVTYKYENAPKLLNVKLISPILKHFRAELVAGLQTYYKKTVSPEPDTLDFRDEEWAHYLGGLLEYHSDTFTAALIYQRRFSRLQRQPAPNSSFDLDFNNRQFSNRGGFFATGKIPEYPIRMEQWIWFERNVDRLQGEKVPDDLTPLNIDDIEFPSKRIPFNFVEKRVKIKSRLLYDNLEKGMLLGLEFHADYRYPQGKSDRFEVRNFAFRTVYPIVRNTNERLTFTIGYRISKNFHFVGGVSYDLDMDKQSGIGRPRITGTPTWFDGGFGRISLSW